ncbi:MAG: hypothetical protein A4E74_01547 [Syntrophus sp. PtaB.Bin075]|nr:MAG: hypothetical protein A4E74_01547 [Syntrophus sp. PtaB.Bin075]
MNKQAYCDIWVFMGSYADNGTFFMISLCLEKVDNGVTIFRYPIGPVFARNFQAFHLMAKLGLINTKSDAKRGLYDGS